MQRSRISTDKNVGFKRIDTDVHGQTLPTKQLKTPGFEVTVYTTFIMADGGPDWG